MVRYKNGLLKTLQKGVHGPEIIDEEQVFRTVDSKDIAYLYLPITKMKRTSQGYYRKVKVNWLGYMQETTGLTLGFYWTLLACRPPSKKAVLRKYVHQFFSVNSKRKQIWAGIAIKVASLVLPGRCCQSFIPTNGGADFPECCLAVMATPVATTTNRSRPEGNSH